MLKILQARLQQYMSQELPDVQAGFRKGRETRDQIANNICWIIEKERKLKDCRRTMKDAGILRLWRRIQSGASDEA